jgi:uncharacterized membrane protein YtjA (UPF0391 family)
MLYWLPRLCLSLFVGAVLGFGLLPATSEDIANTLIVVALGLGLFSLTPCFSAGAILKLRAVLFRRTLYGRSVSCSSKNGP